MLKCPHQFTTARMLYCHTSCGDDWLDSEEGCQKSDADAFCKLYLCDENAFASKFSLAQATNDPGFSCKGHGTNYGNFFGMSDVHFTKDVLGDHINWGRMSNSDPVVTDITCKTIGNHGFMLKILE